MTKPNLPVPAFNLFQPSEPDISHGLLIKTSPALVTNQPLFTGIAVDCPTGANVWLRQKSIVGPVKLNRHWFLCSIYIYTTYIYVTGTEMSFWWNFRHWKNIERKISILMKFCHFDNFQCSQWWKSDQSWYFSSMYMRTLVPEACI